MNKIKPIDYVPTSIAGIELAIFGQDHDTENPIVFVVHGRNSCMQRKYEYCREMAASGITAIALNLRNHGSRSVNPALLHPQRLESVTELLSIIVGTSRDISFLIDMLPALIGLKPQSIGVSGTSLGGTIAIHALLADDRIAAASSLVGTGSFRELCKYHMERNNIPQQQMNQILTPDCEALFKNHDPFEHCETLHKRPLLLTAGEKDCEVPPQTISHFLNELRRQNENAANCHLELFANTGHDVSPEMRAYAINWFKKVLAPATHAPREP